MSPSHALVLGSATNLPASHFLPFFRSLSASGFQGRTCVFVANMPPGERERLAIEVDEVVDVDNGFPRVASPGLLGALRRAKRTRGMRKHFPTLCRGACRLRRASAGSPLAEDLEFRLVGLQSLRYDLYRSYLVDHPEFDQVMISDLRDVIFQRDPFAPPVAGLEVFLEEPGVTFALEGFNRRWIADLYGSGAVDQLGDRVVSCSGVTLGDRDAMVGYLAAMSDEVNRHLPPLGPHDQAMHNWLLANGALEPAHAIANGHGRVLTMGALREVPVADDGTVLNSDGSVPAVLHQYDRHVALAPRLLAPY